MKAAMIKAIIQILADEKTRNKVIVLILSIVVGLLRMLVMPIIVLQTMGTIDESALLSGIDSAQTAAMEANGQAIADALAARGLQSQTIKAQLVYMSFFEVGQIPNFDAFAAIFGIDDDRLLVDCLNAYYELDISYEEFERTYMLVKNVTIDKYLFTNAGSKNSTDLAAWCRNAYESEWLYQPGGFGDLDENLQRRTADNVGPILGYFNYNPTEKVFGNTINTLIYTVQGSMITFRIYEFRNMNLPSKLCEKDFTADIYRLNLFAERLEKLEFSEMVAFKSLLTAKPESSFEDMLMMTYGLDTVPIFPCENFYELGEMVIANDMLAELEGCSDEIIEFLDRETVGRRIASYEDGMFMDGYYCVPSGYEPPDMTIGIGKSERCFFRLLIAPLKQNDVPDYNFAQWLLLPFDEEDQNIDFEKMACVKRESSLPNLSQNQMHTEKNHELNELAKSISELPHDDFVKLKAVMEREQTCEISDTLNYLERLSEYEFDASVQDYSEFGQAYLAKNLPADFDVSVLADMDVYDFGSKILEQTGGEVTSYGAVSGRGQSLYFALTIQQEQQLEEDFEMEMGGVT